MAVNLEGNIILKGKADSSLDSLISKVQSIQSAVEMVGGPIREWEKDSVELYKDYETNMLQARAALSDQYSSYNELNNVMDTLEKQVQDWAENSVFHISDFSDAVNNASHAGWNLNQQLEGIPRAMLLAQAGNMSLADGLSYLARALNVTGTSFEDSGTLVDQWVKASHLANLTIEDLGESLERMGVTAQFANNTAELFTMLDTLAQTGVVGAQAGTLLRGTMLRLIAPTKKAKEAMEELEVTQEEYNELAGESEALTKVNKQLEKTGFSAYDANGKLKPMMQTFGDLYDALVQIAGSEDDLLKNQAVDEILSTLFPTRTISGALAFLKGVKDNWQDLYNEILDSEGAAEKDSETVMSGLMGKQELFLSKWEEFSRKVGEELSGPLETIYDTVGGLIDKLNELPEEQLSALVGGLTTLAFMGPALGVGTGIYKFFSMLGTWGTAAVAASVGIGALVGYLKTASELEFNSQFGELDLDVQALTDYAEGLESKYKAEQEALKLWQGELDAATESYSNFTAALNENLLEDVLTGKTLSKTDQDKLLKYGDDIGKSVLKGIESARERDLNMLDILFDDKSNQKQMDALDTGYALEEAWYSKTLGKAKQIGEDLRAAMVEALKDGTIDANDRAAIMAQEERMNAIMQEINAYNDEVAYNEQLYKAQHVSADSIEKYVDSLAQYDKETKENIENNRASFWAQETAKFDWALKNGETLKFADGTERKVTEEDRDRYMAEVMKSFDEMYSEKHSQNAELANEAMTAMFADSKFGNVYGMLAGMLESGQAQSDGKGNYNFTEDAYKDLSKYTDDQLNAMLEGARFMGENAGALGEMFSEFVDAPAMQQMLDILSGGSALAGMIEAEQKRRSAANQETPGGTDEYGRPNTENIGGITDTETLQRILFETGNIIANNGANFDLDATQQAADQYAQAINRLNELGEDTSQYTDKNSWWQDYLDRQNQEPGQQPQAPEEGVQEPQPPQTSPETAWNPFSAQAEEQTVTVKPELEPLDANQLIALEDQISQSFASGGMTDSLYDQIQQWESSISDFWRNLYGEDFDIQGALDEAFSGKDWYDEYLKLKAEVDTDDLQGQLDTIEVDIKPRAETLEQDAKSALEDQGVEVTVEGDTTALTATIDGADGQTLMEYVSGDNTDLVMSITSQDGQTLVENVHGNASHLASVINSYDGKTITVHIHGVKDFAHGGRATEASIFGEAGPEWAIPEQHTERTAQLLNQAREASGFTWGEILGRFGGLNADPGHVNVNMTYAPTINAANSDGVAEALAADKSRVERIVREAVQKAMSESKLHDELEVYA